MKEYKTTVECLCGSHAVEIECIDPEDEETFITIWYLGQRSNIPLFTRIKAAWQMLNRGYVVDDFILSKPQVIKLRDALNIILDETP